MIKILKDSWGLTKNNLVLAYPLIFFFWIISMLIPSIGGAEVRSLKFGIIFANIIGLVVVFWSGWFEMFAKIAVSYKQDNKTAEKKEYSFALMKEFLPGVGKNFLPYLGGLFLYFLLFCLIFLCAGLIGVKLFGIPQVPENLTAVFSDKQALYKFLSSLSETDKLIYLKWNMLTVSAGAFFSLITMLWAPMIALCSLNPLKAFFLNLKLMFKKPLPVILLYLIYLGANMILSIISSIAGNNLLLQLIAITVMFLFILYYLMLLFLFVEENNENSCDSGFDCVG